MSIVIMILLISALIIVHEIGHFIAARAFGIAVPRFGFGLPIGPTLFKTKIKDTEILIHAFLLGGYVSFLDDLEDSEVPKNSPLRYQNKPIWQRAIVVSAGVTANVIAAIILVMLSAAIWGHLPSNENNIYVKNITAAKEAPVNVAGLKVGDKIKTINGTKITYSGFIPVYALATHKFNGLVTKNRAGEKFAELQKLNPTVKIDEKIQKNTKIILPNSNDEPIVELSQNYLKGLEKYPEPQVKLDEKQIDLRNKLYKRDLYITTEEVMLEDIALAVSDTQSPLNITVERKGESVDLKPLYVDESGRIGIEQATEEILVPTKNIKSIVVESLRFLFETTYLMLLGLVKLFTGQIPFKDLHGIIVITKIGSDIIAYQGLFQGILLTAMISINLAIMNLLPIPALDGGHLLFLTFEKINGKELNEKVLEKISSICFLLLLTLMVLILFNDIYALITKKF